MKYSVFDKSLGVYRVYEGPSQGSALEGIRPPSSPLGSTLDENADVMPSDSKYLGESDVAVGKIAVEGYTLGRFFFFLGASLTAGLLSRWIYDCYIKKR